MAGKNIAEKVGDVTITVSDKVGGVVKAPANSVKKRNNEEESVEDPNRTSFRSRSTDSKKRKQMSEEDIAVFKGLIESKQNNDGEIPVKDLTSEQKESLDILLTEEKQKLDSKLIFLLGFVAAVLVFTILIVMEMGTLIAAVSGLATLGLTAAAIIVPNLASGSSNQSATSELPFAFRQMATELRAGVGFHDSMRSVSTSGYGPLSDEFARALEEIKYGESTEEALSNLSARVNSEGLTRAVYQINRTLSSGGNLSKTLNVIADDIAYEMRMKLRDYAGKLNAFSMIYMMISVVAPVVVYVFAMIAVMVLGPIIPNGILTIVFVFLWPLIVAFIVFMVKRFEPRF